MNEENHMAQIASPHEDLECCHAKPLRNVYDRGISQHPRRTYCKKIRSESNRNLCWIHWASKKNLLRLAQRPTVVGRGAPSPLPLSPPSITTAVAAARMFRPVRFFGIPALIDSLLHDGPVLVQNVANEKHLDVVLDGHQLRVVDPRLLRNVLARIHLHTDRFEPEIWLVLQSDRLLALLVDNAVVMRLDAVF